MYLISQSQRETPFDAMPAHHQVRNRGGLHRFSLGAFTQGSPGGLTLLGWFKESKDFDKQNDRIQDQDNHIQPLWMLHVYCREHVDRCALAISSKTCILEFTSYWQWKVEYVHLGKCLAVSGKNLQVLEPQRNLQLNKDFSSGEKTTHIINSSTLQAEMWSYTS